MRALPLGLILLASLPGPAPAQSMPGLPGGTVGVPANPFASNYPSEPPQVRPRGGIETGTGPHRGTRRHAHPPADGPIPPAGIPGR